MVDRVARDEGPARVGLAEQERERARVDVRGRVDRDAAAELTRRYGGPFLCAFLAVSGKRPFNFTLT